MQNQPSFTTPGAPNPNPSAGASPNPPSNPSNFQYTTSSAAVPQPAAPTTISQPNPVFTTATSNGQPIASRPVTPPSSVSHNLTPKKLNRSLIETIILIIVSLIAVVFIGLFIWKYIEWDNVKTDVDGQIDAAVAMAVAENTTKMENEFVEREKYPYKTFSGPADYGSLNFEFPKTWNTYIAQDAANGGNFEAYLNPGEVQPVSYQTINALRVQILNQTFENVARNYEGLVNNGQLTIATRTIGNTIANVYTGTLQNGIRGIATIFKVRDKTILLQTDAELFAEEYYKLLDTITFAE